MKADLLKYGAFLNDSPMEQDSNEHDSRAVGLASTYYIQKNDVVEDLDKLIEMKDIFTTSTKSELVIAECMIAIATDIARKNKNENKNYRNRNNI